MEPVVKGSCKMLHPTNTDQITPSWFSSILNPVRVDPSTFKMVPNAHEGIGFLSLLARVEFADDHGKKYNFVVKLIPDEDAFSGVARRVVMKEKLDQIEINSYQLLLPALVSEVPRLAKYICSVQFAEIQEADPGKGIPYASVLVLEDLKPQGYTTKLYTDSFTPAEFDQGLDFLAAFHLSSKCLERKAGARLTKEYPWIHDWSRPLVASETEPGVLAFLAPSIESQVKFLASNGKEDLIPSFEALIPNASQLYQLAMANGAEHHVFIHQDLWSHNVLVNSEPGRHVKVIDWQILGFGDPSIDLGTYILSNLPSESLNEVGVERAVRSYYEKYEIGCQGNGIPVGRTLEEFQTFFRTFGLAVSMFWYCVCTDAILIVEGSGPKLLRVMELLVQMNVPEFILTLL